MKKYSFLCCIITVCFLMNMLTVSTNILATSYNKNDIQITEEEPSLGRIDERSETVIQERTTNSNVTTNRYSINWTLNANTAVYGATKMYLYEGDTIRFDLSYIPANSEVLIGIVTPENMFIFYRRTSGSLSGVIDITHTGVHKIKISNISSSNVTVTGTYTTTSTCPHTWYSQDDNTVGTTWDTTYLTSLYCPNMKICDDFCAGESRKCANTPFYTTPEFVPANNQLEEGHIPRFGCSMAAMAMIFANLGATTVDNKYDFRTGTTTHQQADPFTVTMANIYWPAITQNTVNGTTRYEITSYTSKENPTLAYWDNAPNQFGLQAYKVPLENCTPEEKADALAYYVDRNPEGILVRVPNHTLVITGTTHPIPTSLSANIPAPTAITAENVEMIMEQERMLEQNYTRQVSVTRTDYDDKFICCDSGASDASEGWGVTYNNSWTGKVKGGIDQIKYIYYFD